MVSDAYSSHGFGKKENQDIFVSDTLIDELVSLDSLLQEQHHDDAIPLTDSIEEFSRICTKYKHYGIIHLLLGYKDVRKETVWLYAYFIRQSKTLVFLPCSNDPTRDVLMAASTIKNYLQSILSSVPRDGIPVFQMQWKQVSTSSSNSGFHVFKEFLIHAFPIMKGKKDKEDENDYLSMYERDADKNFQDGRKVPNWILRNFTVRQMEQIRNTWREELFTGNRQTIPKLYELIAFK